MRPSFNRPSAEELGKLNGAGGPSVIECTKNHIVFSEGKPGLVLLDFGAKGMPDALHSRIKNADDLWGAGDSSNASVHAA